MELSVNDKLLQITFKVLCKGLSLLTKQTF